MKKIEIVFQIGKFTNYGCRQKQKTPAKVACLRRPVKVRRLRRLPVENDALRA